MLRFTNVCFFVLSLICLSCNKEETPESPPQQRTLLLSGYGSSIDSSYYKVWSDSTWEKFNRLVTIDSVTYTTVVTDDGSEYYYSVLGYAGFQIAGEPLIMFDRPLPSLPDTVVFGQRYTRTTTFFLDGYVFTMKVEQYLQDTVSLSVPFGTFNACLWFNSTTSVSVDGLKKVYSAQFWVAKGPADIKQTLTSGQTIIMVRGRVNRQGWGMAYAAQLPVTTERKASRLVTDSVKPLLEMQGLFRTNGVGK